MKKSSRQLTLMQKIDKMLGKINLNKFIPTKEYPSHYKMGKRGISIADKPTKFELDVIEKLS